MGDRKVVYRGVELRSECIHHITGGGELCELSVAVAIDVVEDAADIEVCSVGVDGVCSSVKFCSESVVERARSDVIRGDVWLIDLGAAWILDRRKGAHEHNTVANDCTIEHLAIDYLQDIEPRRLGYARIRSVQQLSSSRRGKRHEQHTDR